MATNDWLRFGLSALLGSALAWGQGAAGGLQVAPDLFRVPGGAEALARPQLVVDPGLFRLQAGGAEAAQAGPGLERPLGLKPPRRRQPAASKVPVVLQASMPWSQALAYEALYIGWPALGTFPRK